MGPVQACGLVGSEAIFNGLVRALFFEMLVPPGAILDVGANDGRTACLFATLAPTRGICS